MGPVVTGEHLAKGEFLTNYQYAAFAGFVEFDGASGGGAFCEGEGKHPTVASFGPATNDCNANRSLAMASGCDRFECNWCPN
jgi:hypothetical protein